MTADDLRNRAAGSRRNGNIVLYGDDGTKTPLMTITCDEADALADLIDFARHRSSCPNEYEGKVRPERAKCTCGFEDALAALDQEAPT